MKDADVHVALTARLHDSAGTPRVDEAALETLMAAAERLVQGSHLSAPPEPGGDGALILRPDSAGRLLDVTEDLADGLRPGRATFGMAITSGPRVPGSLDSALVGTDVASTTAMTALLATSLRGARVAILAPGRQPLIEALISLILEFTDRMTDRQRQIIALVRESETQQQVARHLGVSRQAVNQSLTSAGWQHIRRAENAAREGLAALARARSLVDLTKGDRT